MFVLGHDGPEVGHGFAVVFCVGDGGERVGPAVVLGDGDDVGPVGRVGEFAHIVGIAEWFTIIKYQRRSNGDD